MKTKLAYTTTTSVDKVKTDMLNYIQIHNISINRLRFDIDEFESSITMFIGMYSEIEYIFNLKGDNVVMEIYLDGRVFKGAITSTNGYHKNFKDIILVKRKSIDLLSGHNRIYRKLVLSKNFKKAELTSVSTAMAFIKNTIDDYEFEYNGDVKIDNSDVDKDTEYRRLSNRLENFFKDNDILSLEPTIDNEFRLGFRSGSFHSNTLVYGKVLDKDRYPIRLELNLNNFIVSRTLKSEYMKYGRIWTNYTDCELCGSINTSTVVDKVSGINKRICMSCYTNIHKRIRSEYTALSGIVYTGKEASRQRAFDQRTLERERKIKDGEVFKCSCCKRYVDTDYKSKNPKVDICNRCARHHIEMREIANKPLTNKERYKHYVKEKTMSNADKANRAQSEQDMIAEFLANKK